MEEAQQKENICRLLQGITIFPVNISVFPKTSHGCRAGLKLEQRSESPHPAYLMSWWFTWAGGGGTKEPVMNQGLPVAGKEVGLMYSFSSQSDDGFSAPDAAGRDLTAQETKIKAHQNGRQ